MKTFLVLCAFGLFIGSTQVAAAQSESVRPDCAVFYVGPESAMVVIAAKDGDPDHAAAFCTSMIDTGEWTGIGNDAQWEGAFVPMALVTNDNGDLALTFWAHRDVTSQLLASFVSSGMAIMDPTFHVNIPD